MIYDINRVGDQPSPDYAGLFYSDKKCGSK